MKKKVVCLLLAMAMALGLCSPVFAAENEPVANASASTIQAEGTNPIGNLIANELSPASSAAKAQRHISNLTVSGKSATVELVTDIACELVVALYDESTGKMTASGNAIVSANTTNAYISLSGDVPTYFVATAYLMDSVGHEPLCEEYSSTLYTQGIQDLEDSTIDDYEEDQVVNLDDNPATNFMVYGADTEVIEPTGTMNQLVNHGNGNYTVTNADETFLSLKAGDVFSYSQTGDELLLVKVKSISISGSTVTIVEDKGADINDFFDVVKIDVGADEDEDDIATIANINKELKKTVSAKLGEKLIQGSIKTEVSVKFKLYTNGGNKYVELKATTKCEFNVSINGKIPLTEFTLADVYFTPFPGLKIGVKLDLNLEVSGKVSYIATIKKTTGFAYDNGVWVDKSSEPKQDVKLETSVEATLELVLSPYADFFEIVKVSMGGKVETNISAKMALLDSEEKIHSCENCVEGEIKVKGSLFVSLKIAVLEFKKEWSIAQTVAEFYYSIDHREFGWGKCPYISYKITLIVNGVNGDPLSDVSVNADSLDEAVITDEDGEVEFYLSKGSHTIELTYGEVYKTEDIYVEDDDRTIVIVLEDVDTPTATPTPPAGLGDVIDSGVCGENGANMMWSFTDDGTLTIYGSGRMADYGYYSHTMSDAPWKSHNKNVKAIEVKTGVTYIGAFAFTHCYYLRNIVLPEGLTAIGPNAFEFCEDSISGGTKGSGTTIVFPSTLKEIGADAFDGTDLVDVTLPDGLTTIGRWAFAQSDIIETVTIPASVSMIGEGAFCGDTGLRSIQVASGNKNFISRDGVLFSSDMKTLILYPEGKTGPSYSVPDGVTKINDYAFWQDTNARGVLNKVNFPDTLKSIGEFAFYDVNLSDVDIPQSVTEIGQNAFASCRKLANIRIYNRTCDIQAERDGLEAALGEKDYTTVWGYAGSTAESYAKKYGYQFSTLGALAASAEEKDVLIPIPDDYVFDSDGNVEPTLPEEIDPTPEITIPSEDSSVVPPTDWLPDDSNPEWPEPVSPDYLPEEEYAEPQGSIDGVPADIELLASHSPSSVGSNTALFTGLEAGKDYILIVAVNINATDLLAPDNLLFIAQTAADGSGRIAFAYTPRKSGGTARAYGPGDWTPQSTPSTTPPTNGWFADDSGSKFYYKNGKAVKGWNYIDSEWYYFDDSGRMVTGDWAQDSRGWYFLDEDGKMMSGFREIDLGRPDDGWYYFNEEHDGSFGRVMSGWIDINGNWYYFNEKHDGTYGRMVIGDWAQDRYGWYFLDANGKMMSGFSEIDLGRSDDGWYYFNPKHDGSFGRVLCGWQYIDGDWYYFNEKHDGTWGRMVTGNWARDAKYWYFLGEDGKMLSGLKEINLGRSDDGLYYFNTSHDGTYGRMMTGWQTINGNLYYFETRHNGTYGAAFRNSIWTINGWFCAFDEDGVCYLREYIGW